MKIEMIKCHGSANDFILIDEYSNDYSFTDEQREIITKELCNREGLVGADGVLFVQKSEVADARMRIFNSDGSEPEMCGNGLRCAGRYVVELLNRDKVIIETKKAILDVEKVEDIYENVKTYEVLIGPVSFELSSLPMQYQDRTELINSRIPEFSENQTFTALSIPNPHLISIVGRVNEEEVRRIGQQANEGSPIFPKGVNVSYVSVLGDSQIFVQTYERGVGITNSCGTAMSASSLVTCLLEMNHYNSDISVYNKGGMVKCMVRNHNDELSVKLKGNATYVYTCTIDFSFDHPQAFTKQDVVSFEEEVQNYAKLQEFAKDYVSTLQK